MRRFTAVALVLGLLASACGTSPGYAAAAEVRSGAARAAADPAAARSAALALDAFSADLYRAMSSGGGNLVLSPYSVATALAMARAGAAGETRSQIDTVLHAGAAGDLDAGLNALDQALAKRAGTYKVGEQSFDLELATANRLWGQKDFRFEAPFLDRLAADYGAGMQIVDYKRAPEDSRRAINAWVAARTKDRITDLIPQGVIDQMTRLVLTNAIYLRASWTQKLSDAVPGTFHRADGTNVSAQMMSLAEHLRYSAGDGYEVVAIPYVGGLSMVLIVPSQGGTAAFERGLDGARLRRAIGALGDAQVKLTMPKFQFRSRAQLKDALGALGMPIAFTDRADFTAITKEEPLTIADVVHQAFIAVDEKGTEAAAATGIVFRATAAPQKVVELTVDRPFVFVIQDDETGTILFMGRVTDPTS